jgi:hypothetical protein
MATFTWAVDDHDLIGEMRNRGELLDAAILSAVNSLGAQLLARVQTKLSGEVLASRTGQLLNSVEQQAAEFVGSVCQTSVGIDEGSPSFLYGYVQEYGGSKWYEIVPVQAQVLAFEGPEGIIFAKSVHHPPLPERSYLRSSLAEMEDMIYAELEASVGQVLTAEMV